MAARPGWRERLRGGASCAPGLLALAVAAILIALLVSPVALADSSAIPKDTALPWTDPSHHSPLEVLAGRIASHIAGRRVGVRCEGENDWSILARQRGLPAAELGGYVDTFYYASSREIARSPQFTELSPQVCSSLQKFAQATSKPTKCTAPRTQTHTVYETVRTRVPVRVYGSDPRIQGGGQYTIRFVWRTRRVPRTVATTTAGPAGPCFLGAHVARGSGPGVCSASSCYAAASSEPSGFWRDYDRYAQAMLALAHESIHLAQDRAGASIDAVLPSSETQANCSGLQWIPYVAVQLGDTPDDAQAIAEYAFDVVYPGFRGASLNGSPYWSASCVPGGSLDIRPAGATAWP